MLHVAKAGTARGWRQDRRFVTYGRLDGGGAQRAEVGGGVQRGFGLGLQCREVDVFGDFAHDEPVRGYVDDREVGVDPAHRRGGGQRVFATPADPRSARFGRVFDQNPDLFRADREVHRTPDAGRKTRVIGRPIGKVTVLCNLKGAEQGQVEMTAADHQKRVGMVNIAAAGH